MSEGRRDGSRWRCARCGNREASPLEEVCPNCGVAGDRYPLKATAPELSGDQERARGAGDA